MSTFDYFSLANLSQDVNAYKCHLRGKPYRIENVMPLPVTLIASQPHDGYGGPLGRHRVIAKLGPHGTIEVPDSAFGDGDVLYVTSPMAPQGPAGGTRLRSLMRPVFLSNDARLIRLGEMAYYYWDTNETNSRTDIMSVRVHNYLTLPIALISHGKVIGVAEADDRLTYLGGSASSVYLTNDGFGYNIGDSFDVVLRDSGVLVGRFTFTDNHTRDIYVGVIGTHAVQPPADVYSYRMTTPDISATKHFPMNGRYASGSILADHGLEVCDQDFRFGSRA